MSESAYLHHIYLALFLLKLDPVNLCSFQLKSILIKHSCDCQVLENAAIKPLGFLKWDILGQPLLWPIEKQGQGLVKVRTLWPLQYLFCLLSRLFVLNYLLRSLELKILVLPVRTEIIRKVNKETGSFLAQSQLWILALVNDSSLLCHTMPGTLPFPPSSIFSLGLLLCWRPTSFSGSGGRLQESWVRIRQHHLSMCC